MTMTVTRRITKRARCPKCKTSQKLRKNGRIGGHTMVSGFSCPGVGLKPRLSGAQRRKLNKAKNPGTVVTVKTNTSV